jgi:hypothetical protein
MPKEIVVAIIAFLSAVTSAVIAKGNTYVALGLLVVATALFGHFIYMYKLRRKKIDLNAHPFWSRMKYYIEHKIPNLQIENPLRKKIMTFAMTKKFEAGRDILASCITSESLNVSKVRDLVNDIITTYETQWRLYHVPEVFITRFYTFHKPKIDSTIAYLEFICTSDFYTDTDKRVAILDGMLHAFHWTMIDIERVGKSMNGELDNELIRLHNEGKI